MGAFIYLYRGKNEITSVLLSGGCSIIMCLPNPMCSLAFKLDSKAVNEQKTQQKPCLKYSRRTWGPGITFKDIRLFICLLSYILKRFRRDRVKSWPKMNKVICSFFILQKVRHVLLHVFAMSKNRYWKDSKFHFA